MTILEQIFFGCLMVGLILFVVFGGIAGLVFLTKLAIDIFNKWGDLTMKTYEATEQAYKNGYKQGKADAMKWIPVTERLPQEKGEICKNAILFMDDGLVTVGWLNQERMSAFYLDTRNDFVSKVPLSRCTHWMPMPEPPKGE